MDWVVGNPEKMNSLTSACLFQMMSQLQNNEKKETIRKMHREHPPWVCKRVACVKGFWLQSHLGRGGECAQPLLLETMVAPHRADPASPSPGTSHMASVAARESERTADLIQKCVSLCVKVSCFPLAMQSPPSRHCFHYII